MAWKILTGVRGVHVHPDVLVVAHLGDLVQTVERTAAGGAQRGHHEERDQPFGAVLADGVAERLAAELVLIVRVERAEQHAAEQTGPFHGRVGQRGRIRHQLGHDVLVHERRIGVFHCLKRPRLSTKQRHQSGFAGRSLQANVHVHRCFFPLQI